MDISVHGNLSVFDEIRLTYGIDNLKKFFLNLVKTDREKVIHLINDDRLHFYSLFELQPEIRANKLYEDLIPRYKNALNIIDIISAVKSIPGDQGYHLYGNKLKSTRTQKSAIDYRQMSHSSLKWMLETGFMDNGRNDRFDAILDSTAALLIKSFNDKSVLPLIAEMIFDRHRKGLFYYDLVWAFFEACEPCSLTLAANRLCSRNLRDVDLARRLLNFIPYISTGETSKNIPGYVPGYVPGFAPGYTPMYAPVYNPVYDSGHDPVYVPGYDVYDPVYNPGYDSENGPENALMNPPEYNPEYAPGHAPDNLTLYKLCLEWLGQNLPFLYYTGDTFQQTCNPIPYAVAWEAKYLCKVISANTGKILAPLTKDEEKLLLNFKAQSHSSKVILADYSFRLYRQDRKLWNTWFCYPVADQVRMAAYRMGGGIL